VSRTETLAVRYAVWLRRRARALVVLSVVAFAGSAYLVADRLPVLADFSHLLPQDAPSVRDLRRLSERLVARDTVLVIVRAPDPSRRAAAASELARGARAIRAGLVERVEEDDAETRAFVLAHRHLLVPLSDLIEVRDSLARTVRANKLAANPLFIDLDDSRATGVRDRARLDELAATWREAETRLLRSSYTSPDGKLGLVVIRTTFSTTDVGRGKQLLAELADLRARIQGGHPGVEIGFTGGVTTAVAEHTALLGSVLRSSVITGVLVALLLVVYLRSARLVVLLACNLGLATTAAFAVAVFTVGHLNAATAFLGAIIAGNGVNYGILLIARYREERMQAEATRAMGLAIARTLRPTLIASFGAAIAYGSLAVTSFRGFADFATVGSIGMLLCWLASYLVLPALVLWFAPGPDEAHDHGAGSGLGRVLARIFGTARPATVLWVAGGLGLVATGIVARYLIADPFEYDMHALRSVGPAAAESQRWLRISDAVFGKSISGRIIIAADRRDQVPLIVNALRAIEADRPPAERVIGGVSSILDVVPPDQPQRIAVLGEIQSMLDDPAMQQRDQAGQAMARELRPPEVLRPVIVEELPPEIREQLTERDGRVGYLVSVRPGPKLDQWNGRDLIRLASAVRSLRLADGETVTTSGTSVIFADIMSALEQDGPVVTLVAACSLVVMVVFVAGRRRIALAVLVATCAGSLAMVAVCALIGLRVNFLDFVALPITLGLGVDYAINVAHRAQAGANPALLLRTTGSAVLVCSLTTIIGYASLLFGQNQAIRGFGLASLLGEITCVISALALVPAIVFAERRWV